MVIVLTFRVFVCVRVRLARIRQLMFQFPIIMSRISFQRGQKKSSVLLLVNQSLVQIMGIAKGNPESCP